MNIGFTFVWSAMLRLVARQMDVMENSAHAFAALDGLVGLDTAAVLHSTRDGFLGATGLFDLRHLFAPLVSRVHQTRDLLDLANQQLRRAAIAGRISEFVGQHRDR
jgi:hypothetical protein